MKKLASSLIIIFWSLLVQAQDKQLVLTHVFVVDMTREHIQKDMTVVITGNKITSVSNKKKIRKNATVIDATGKYLIPGLWDMHAHMIGKARLNLFIPLFIANGITGVRDMGTPYDEFIEYTLKRDAIESRKSLRIKAAGPFLDGPKPTHPSFSLSIAGEADARQWVQELKRNGVDFIKVYNLLPREAYYAIVDEANKQGLSVAGHVPFSIHLEEAIEAGQKSIEHLHKCILSCAKNKDQLEDELLNATRDSDGPGSWRAREVYDEKALLSLDKAIAATLYKKMKDNHTYQCPTLVIRSFFSDTAAMTSFEQHPYMNFYPHSFKAELIGRYNSFFAKRGIDDQNRAEKLYKESLRQVFEMHQAGVHLLAGTDVPGFGTFPGISLHAELSLFAEAGLSPYEALKTATVNPAKYFGMEKILGTIEKGKLADLVLLDANPLENIGNTQKIYAVIINGELLDRNDLNKLLNVK